MTVYGDLDQTVLDELPVGRTPVATVWLNGPEEYPAAWELVRKQVAAGHQAYVICPLVGGGEPEDDEPEELEVSQDEIDFDYEQATLGAISKLPLPGLDVGAEPVAKPPPKSAVEEFSRLCAGELAGCAVGLLHGQLPSKQKEATMAAFRRGELNVLVADDGHRGGRRRRERDGDRDRRRRPLWHRPAAPAAGKSRPRWRRVLVLPVG